MPVFLPCPCIKPISPLLSFQAYARLMAGLWQHTVAFHCLRESAFGLPALSGIPGALCWIAKVLLCQGSHVPALFYSDWLLWGLGRGTGPKICGYMHRVSSQFVSLAHLVLFEARLAWQRLPLETQKFLRLPQNGLLLAAKEFHHRQLLSQRGVCPCFEVA